MARVGYVSKPSASSGLHCAALRDRPCLGFAVMRRTERNHAGRVVVVLFLPRRIEVVILKVWVPATGRRAPKPDHSTALFKCC
jgi:hypothetical protein